MTIFYILLYYACELIGVFNKPGSITETFRYMYYVLIAFAVIRIILCIFPQNNWFHKEGNQKWGIIRNVPFDDDWGLLDPTSKSDDEFIKVINEIVAKLKVLAEA